MRRFLLAVCLVMVSLAFAGCATSPPDGTPAHTKWKAQGKERVHYVAEADGCVYVTDQWDGKMIWSGDVSKGDTVVVQPREDRITVNDQPVYSQKLYDNDHWIFFAERR